MDRQQEYFDFLEELRDTGACNMYGAAPYLEEAFPELDRKRASAVLRAWMDSFSGETR